MVTGLSELVDDGTEEQEVDDRPGKLALAHGSSNGVMLQRSCSYERFAYGARILAPLNTTTKYRDSPDQEDPWCGGEVCLLSSPVNFTWSSNCIDVGAQEQEVNEDVDNLSCKLASANLANCT